MSFVPTEPERMPRRALLTRTALATAAGGLAGAALASGVEPTAAAAPAAERNPFGYALNMSTIRGQKLSVPEQINVAAKAGYQGIEPWIGELQAYADGGGSLADLKKRIDDAGLQVVSAIGFAQWIVDDPAARAKGLEQAKRDMELVATIGGTRIAAPPAGATKERIGDLLAIAERYARLLEIGDQTGVVPQVEIWGPSATLNRLGEAVCVAVESGHPRACLLPDVYHIFRGGSAFTGLGLLGGAAIHVFHVNDYPDSPPRTEMTDKHRVFPGDGVAPLNDIFRGLRDAGIRCMLSLELFNETYWKMDPLEAAREGLEKTRAAVERALA